jgi:TonB family protein
MRMVPLPAVVLLASALAAACATGGPPPSSLLSDEKHPAPKQCAPAADPAVLPDPAALVDTAVFRNIARQLWMHAGRPDGYVLIALRHSPDGAQVYRAAIETTAPAGITDSLAMLAFAARRETPQAPREWGVRLRVDLGDPVRLRVGRRLACEARPREWAYRTAGSPFDIRDSQGSWSTSILTDPGIVWVRVKVDASGTVTDATVDRSYLRGGAWQSQLLNYVRSMAFDPATEDGYPVASEIVVPVRLAQAR